MLEYHRHLVRLLWQSKHASRRRRESERSPTGLLGTGGFEWLRP